ncbi:MAG: hypothetical protein HETSPECPRED_004176 [Heterodermia speciosa]|uniref:FAD-binding FR-type domain-containing protein n=1 Tax=Heterodermia speciosa TaxID=116794 RepID=A0A8H3F8X4_9LECA|nr:MAG: hypothetical protein HETSPECPRED_004176 [Heterodermia speciosa]
MSGEMSGEAPRDLTWTEKFDRWMVNEGYRRLFVLLFVAVHGMVYTFGFLNFHMKDNLTTARATFGITYPIARAAALVLHFDIAILIFPVCRTLISLARQTPLNGIIQFDKNITFHKLVAWSIVFFSWVHTIAHWNNYAQLAAKNNLGFKGWLLGNFVTGPGWSGYVMLTCLMLMVATSIQRFKSKNFERFWYTHHLFIVFFIFWSVHGAFCLIKTDSAPFCAGTGVFWEYWMYGGFIYLLERIAREIRGRHKTFVSKVIQHPSNVVEIQMKKENTKTRAGQYIFLCCPEISIWQYHPFTLTSAPEEDYISVHVRCVGNFTKALGKALGCQFERGGEKKGPEGSAVVGVDDRAASSGVDPAIRKILPRVYVDGPFGSASEDVFKYEVAVLVGAGIGVTPFASILKSIWYRMNYPQQKTRLRKVYFFWVCRDFGSFEWFRSLLMAIEAQDMDSHIEIHTVSRRSGPDPDPFEQVDADGRLPQYLTAKIKADDATNIMINDADADKDTITGLRAPTNFGRPNWDAVFKSIRKIHSPAEAGVFFCGPKVLGSQLHIKCNMYSEPGFHFVWGKENF